MFRPTLVLLAAVVVLAPRPAPAGKLAGLFSRQTPADKAHVVAHAVNDVNTRAARAKLGKLGKTILLGEHTTMEIRPSYKDAFGGLSITVPEERTTVTHSLWMTKKGPMGLREISKTQGGVTSATRESSYRVSAPRHFVRNVFLGRVAIDPELTEHVDAEKIRSTMGKFMSEPAK